MLLRKAVSKLVSARPCDLPVIKRWLVRSDIRRWWGSPIGTHCEMRLGIVSHRNLGRIFLILDIKNKPIGLVSMIHAKALASSRIGWPKFLPSNAWEIGILIAERSNRQRGIGTTSLLEAQKNVSKHSKDPVFAWIEKDNTASLAMVVRLGYRRVFENETTSYSSAVWKYTPEQIRDLA
jgi:Acetyltransferase (GNAT) domain